MLNKTIAKFVFYTIVIVLLGWTSSLTYSFLSMAMPGEFWLVPLFGLVVFDGGMIGWLIVFLSFAEGAIQRAVALILTLFNFVGVGLMTIAEILLGGQSMTAAPEMLGTAAIWGIGIWTVVNVLGVLLFHLGDNQARRAMAYQAEKDAIFDAALGDLKNRRIAIQSTMSAEMSRVMMDELIADLRTDIDGDGRRDMLERRNDVGPAVLPMPAPEPRRRTWIDNLQDDIAAAIPKPNNVGNSTHDASRHNAAEPVREASPNGSAQGRGIPPNA